MVARVRESGSLGARQAPSARGPPSCASRRVGGRLHRHCSPAPAYIAHAPARARLLSGATPVASAVRRSLPGSPRVAPPSPPEEVRMEILEFGFLGPMLQPLDLGRLPRVQSPQAQDADRQTHDEAEAVALRPRRRLRRHRALRHRALPDVARVGDHPPAPVGPAPGRAGRAGARHAHRRRRRSGHGSDLHGPGGVQWRLQLPAA